MLIRILFTFLAFSAIAIAADTRTPAPAPDASSSSSPHPAAASFQFDSYIVALLVRPADAPELSKPELDKLQEQHMANIRRLAKEGKLFKAGPTKDYSGRNIRGVFIFKTDSLEKARAWVATDPAVQRGRLKPEFFKWSVEKGSLK
jgi:uncharacterized protein YciI